MEWWERVELAGILIFNNIFKKVGKKYFQVVILSEIVGGRFFFMIYIFWKFSLAWVLLSYFKFFFGRWGGRHGKFCCAIFNNSLWFFFLFKMNFQIFKYFFINFVKFLNLNSIFNSIFFSIVLVRFLSVFTFYYLISLIESYISLLFRGFW